MKSNAIKKPFPASLAEWEILISEAPGEESIPDPEEEQAFWDKAVVVREGGSKAVHEALKAKRARGQQKTPTKQPISIRLSTEVVEYFKSTGKGCKPAWMKSCRTMLKHIGSSFSPSIIASLDFAQHTTYLHFNRISVSRNLHTNGTAPGE